MSQRKDCFDETKTYSIDQMLIGWNLWGHPQKWTIKINASEERVPLQSSAANEYANFELFQNVLTCTLSTDNVRSLVIGDLKDVSLDLAPSEFKPMLSVENVIFLHDTGEHVENILSQLKPVSLRKIVFKNDGMNENIYDLPQVINAENLEISDCSIREDQLMKLKARYMKIDYIDCSVSKYIKKCALEASTKLPHFSFAGPKVLSEFKNVKLCLFKKMTLKTDHPQVSLQLETSLREYVDASYKVEGRTCFDSEITASNLSRRNQFELRRIKLLKLCYNQKLNLWYIKVKRDDFKETGKFSFGPEKYDYKFHLFANAQEKIDEILANTDLIDVLNVNVEGLKKQMKWSRRDKKLTVRELFVTGDHSTTSIFELMRQIEPKALKTLHIMSKEVDNQIFEMPHMAHVTDLDISGVVLQDSQLLSMKTQLYGSTDRYSNGVQNKSLTAKGINQYMKKCLFDKQQSPHIFVFKNLASNFDWEELFEGFNIVKSSNTRNSVVRRINIPETDESYELSVEYTRDNCLYGVKRNIHYRVDHFLPFLKEGIQHFVAFSEPHDLTNH